MIVVDKRPRLEHKVRIDQTSAAAVERMCSWCHEQFGRRFSIVDRLNFSRDGTWQCMYDGVNREHDGSQITYVFSFDHEQDAVVFALRWA